MVREEAVDWLEEAVADLERAVRAEGVGDYSLACFMAQQAVEKAFKACYIGLLRRRPPRDRDLVMLYSELKGTLSLPGDVEEALPELSQYYVTARYPNAGLRRPSASFSRAQAVRAIEVARGVVERVREALATP